MEFQERAMAIIAAVVATLAQALLAPHISIGYALPNFMAATCVVIAMLHPRTYGAVLPFVMGLLFDLISGGPVGAMAFSLTAFSVGTAWFFERANNDTLFMTLVSVAIGLLLVEVSYGMFILLFGYSANFIEAFAFRMMPCYLYDLVLSVVGYFIAHRLSTGGSTVQPEITQLQ